MADSQNTPTPTLRVRLYRIGGALGFLGLSVGTATLASKWPWVVPIGQLATWYIGKLLGIPVNDILAAALAKKSPTEVADIAVKAITSMPVAQISPVTRAVIESIRPIAAQRSTLVDLPRPPRVPDFPVEITGESDLDDPEK